MLPLSAPKETAHTASAASAVAPARPAAGDCERGLQQQHAPRRKDGQICNAPEDNSAKRVADSHVGYDERSALGLKADIRGKDDDVAVGNEQAAAVYACHGRERRKGGRAPHRE